MLLDDTQHALYIFGGQRSKSAMTEMLQYNIGNDTLTFVRPNDQSDGIVHCEKDVFIRHITITSVQFPLAAVAHNVRPSTVTEERSTC